VTGPDGTSFATVRGPAEAGLNRVTWNMRGAAAAADGPGPYQARQRAQIAERAAAVRDSLVSEGWNEQLLDRMIGMFTGEAGMSQMAALFGGGGAPGGDPEGFRARPGESAPGGGGGFDFGQMRELAEILVPGAGMSQLRRMFGGGGGGGQAPLAEPGTYTLSLTAGDDTFSTELQIERIGALTGESAPFEGGTGAGASPHRGSPNAVSRVPDPRPVAMTTYWRPSLARYVVGFAYPSCPSSPAHSSSPVRLSNA
jgi:hypothetical protein